MKTILVVALISGLSVASAFAGETHMDRETREVLRNYNIQYPVSELTNGQKGQILLLAHMDDNTGVRTQIMSVLGQGVFTRFLRN